MKTARACPASSMKARRSMRKALSGVGVSLGVIAAGLLGAPSQQAQAQTALPLPVQNSNPAAGQSTLPTLGPLSGLLNAMALGDAPNQARPIAVVLYDDSRANREIASAFVQALEQAGYRISETADLELSFGTDIATAPNRPGPRSTLGLSGTVGSDSDPKLRGHVTLYADDQNGLLLPDIPPRQSEGGPFLRLDTGLTDRANGGKRIWQGWATATMPDKTIAETATAMVPHLVGALGTTVRNQEVTLGAGG
ncbi:MAG: hypothetical protein ACPGYL_01505 [Rhodospirillaceae bacterium]